MEWTDYLEAARLRLGLRTPSALALRLGQASNMIAQYRRGGLPSERMLLAVAEAAGIADDRALADLTRWRAERSGEPRAIEAARRLAARVTVIALALLAPMGNETAARTSYLDIMRKRRPAGETAHQWLAA